MADAKISQLSLETSLTGTEELEIVTGGVNKRTTTQDIADLGGGGTTVASQAETNTGSNDTKAVSPLKLKNRDADVTALTDGATIDITSDKCTLATSSATRTFTISHTGDDITIEVTLSATSAVYTFPATALCVSDGLASGDNTLSIAGVSGDKYIIAIKKIGSAYYVVSKNFGQ